MLRAGYINPITMDTIRQLKELGIERNAYEILEANRKGFACIRCKTHIFVTESESAAMREKYGVEFY